MSRITVSYTMKSLTESGDAVQGSVNPRFRTGFVTLLATRKPQIPKQLESVKSDSKRTFGGRPQSHSESDSKVAKAIHKVTKSLSDFHGYFGDDTQESL